MKNILIINCAEADDRTFVEPIEMAVQRSDAVFETVHRSAIPAQRHRYHGVIVSASPQGDDIVVEAARQLDWIRSYHRAVLGICAGHQILGKLSSAILRRGEEPEDGVNCQVEVLTEDPLFAAYTGELQVEQHHNDSIALPVDFTQMATSTTCEVQAMRHVQWPYYSVQWHAERSNPDLIQNFVNRIVVE